MIVKASYSHEIIACSRMEKAGHSGIPEGTDLSWIDFTDPILLFVGEGISLSVMTRRVGVSKSWT